MKETSGSKSSAASTTRAPDTSSSRTSPDLPRSASETSRLTDAYAAGLIDGEGCLYIGPNLRPVVQIGMAMKGKPTVERLGREYGGRFRTAWKGDDRWSEEIRWTIQSAELVEMLRRISPFLRLKGEQARLLLRAAEIHDELPKIGRKRWTPEARERVETLRRRVMEMNRRGPSTEPVLKEGAVALLAAGTWVTPQTDLFSDLGFTPFSGPWPRSGTSRDGIVYELPMSERLTAGTDGSASPDFLLPTPSAQESTPTDEFLDEFREYLDPDDPLHRLWLPGRQWMTQRTLSRVVPALVAEGGDDDEDALLPTPGAWLGRRPENAKADPERAASREHEGTRGKRSLELPDALAQAGVGPLLPTPVGSDARGLTDGDTRDGGPSLREIDRLLPTPTTQDGKNTAGPSQHERNSDPLNVVAANAADGNLLPTRTGRRLGDTASAADADGTRSPRAGRDAERGGLADSALSTLVEKYEMNPENALYPGADPRLLPTPQAADGDGGRQEKGAMGAAGKRPSGHKATLPLGTAVGMRETISETPFTEDVEQPSLLPTPVANPDNPGTGGELRAALVHGEGRRNETGTDTRGRPNSGRPSKILPTPMASDGEKGSKGQRFGTGGPTLSAAVNDEAELLPTPTPGDVREPSDHPASGPAVLKDAAQEIGWGVYEAAIRRWEGILGREAPVPTDEKGRLAPAFVEWMLGYPEGWISAIDIPRTAQLRILGNSVQVDCGERVGEWLARLSLSGVI